MRAIHVAALCVLLLGVGLTFAFARRLPFLAAREASQSRVLTSSQTVPASSADEGTPGIPATAGLACVQNALGGAQAIAGVSSIRIVGTTRPTATTTTWRPVANKREIGVVFPDRYKRSDMQIDAPPGLAPMTSVVGFNGSDLLFDLMNKRPVELSVSKEMLNVRRGFVREILMRLPRQLSDVRLSQRTTRDVGQERLAIEAFDSDGLVVTLLADSVTCMPVALQYMGSGPTGAAIFRVELAEYRRYNGILIPTMLKTTKDGEPYSEEHDSEIQPNARLDDRYFRRAGS